MRRVVRLARSISQRLWTMSSDVEYLLLKEKGPYHEVFVRRRLNTNPGACKFYTTVISTITVSLVLLLVSLVYVFVLVPARSGHVLTWDGRTAQQVQQARVHVITHTQCGLVEGVIEDQVYVFKGIPYAVPPVGSRRWEKPQPLTRAGGTCWRGAYKAKEFGSPCVQTHLNNYSRYTGDENCLFVNVWTQSLNATAKRPVLFWIHGGNLVFGSGNMPNFQPTTDVTRATEAVYVSLNYRLGPLGFLTLDVLREGSATGTTGNYGFMDMLLALQWVRDNINNFGGDPHKVTIFGHSSGGTSIHALLASPLARGLFQRAWLASPSSILNKTSSQASKDNLIFLKRTGCSDATCLRKLSAVQIMAVTPWDVYPHWNMDSLFDMPSKGQFIGALAVVDGYVLKESPVEAWRNGRGNYVPTLFSTTTNEVDFLTFDPAIAQWSWDHYSATVRSQLTPFSADIASRALDLYPADRRHTPEYQYTRLVTDARTACAVDVISAALALRSPAPVFRAVGTASPSSRLQLFNVTNPRYAFHGWDLIVFFGDFQTARYHPKPYDLAYQQVMREQVMEFARHGRPKERGCNVTGACTVLLSDHVTLAKDYQKRRCQFWMANGFFSYAWIN